MHKHKGEEPELLYVIVPGSRPTYLLINYASSIAPTGHPSFASAALSRASSGTSVSIATATPSPMENTSGQVPAHNPQPIHSSLTRYFMIPFSLSKTSFFSFLLTPLDVSAAITQLIITNPIVIEIRQNVVHRRLCYILQRLLRQESLM